MIIPILHFCGDCQQAIALYEKAFNTQALMVITNDQYSPDEHAGDTGIAHSEMMIQGQKVFLNDRFGNHDQSLDVPVRLIVMFESVEALLASYEYLKEGSVTVDPFEELPYSPLFGNFIDRFGIGWGFMVQG